MAIESILIDARNFDAFSGHRFGCLIFEGGARGHLVQSIRAEDNGYVRSVLEGGGCQHC